jgi:hypothetical protein
MRTFYLVLATVFLGVFGPATQLRAQSETIQIPDVPKVVMDAVKAKFPDAQVQKAKKKVQDGMTFYAIGLTSKGAERNALLTDKGKIVELKKVVPATELPAKAAEAIYAAYPNSTTTKAKKVTEYKEEKSFEVEVITADKQTKKLVLDAEGKIKQPK